MQLQDVDIRTIGQKKVTYRTKYGDAKNQYGGDGKDDDHENPKRNGKSNKRSNKRINQTPRNSSANESYMRANKDSQLDAVDSIVPSSWLNQEAKEEESHLEIKPLNESNDDTKAIILPNDDLTEEKSEEIPNESIEMDLKASENISDQNNEETADLVKDDVKGDEESKDFPVNIENDGDIRPKYEAMDNHKPVGQKSSIVTRRSKYIPYKRSAMQILVSVVVFVNNTHPFNYIYDKVMFCI